ncbi:FixH family protein [beta proteobacterium MWH-UniP1]
MRMSTQPNQPARPANVDTKPWYRHGWVWFLIGIPATSVVLGSIFIWISFTQADSLVADDYYKQGRGINQRLEKDQAAVDRGVQLSSSVLAQPNGDQRIEIRFTAKPGVEAPEMLRIRLSHPTIDQRDILATLVKSGPGVYRTDVPGISSGRWYVQVEDDRGDWRVRSVWKID